MYIYLTDAYMYVQAAEPKPSWPSSKQTVYYYGEYNFTVTHPSVMGATTMTVDAASSASEHTITVRV